MAGAAILLILCPQARALDDGLTDYVTVPAGSYLIDMGASPQTVANGLKPYGLVYALIVHQRTPVDWAINPAKGKDGIDFTYNGKDYKGGPFIVHAEDASPAVVTVINNWKAQGVLVDGPIAAAIPDVPIYETLNSLAKLALDTDNGAITAKYLVNAGIPTAAYSLKLPGELTTCEDIFALPHADPTWATHNNLIPFVQAGGYVWAACHAVSVLENIDDPADPDTDPDLNFLSANGLVLYGDHGDGSPPYTYAAMGDANPAMQFLGILDAATANGSEQIFLPTTAGWRASTRIHVYDPTQADVPLKSPGEAVVLAVGRAFGNNSHGRVMYEAGHDHSKSTAAANVAAQRAFLNFYLLSGIERRPEPGVTAPALIIEQTATNVSGTVSGGGAPYSYEWSSSLGGTFGNPAALSTTYTPPNVSSNSTEVIKLTVTDACGRVVFQTADTMVEAVPIADLAVTVTASANPVTTDAPFAYTLAVINYGSDTATNVVVTNRLPDDVGFSSATGAGWACAHSNGWVTCTRAALDPNPLSPSLVTLTLTAPPTAGVVTNHAGVSSPINDPVSANNTNVITTIVVDGADLALTRSGPAAAYVGLAFSYTLTVTNPSLLTASNLVLSDVLPTELDYAGATGNGWSLFHDPDTRTFTGLLPSLASLGSSTVTVTVVPAEAGSGLTLTNQASLEAATPDPDPGNNTATSTVTIAPSADLRVIATTEFDAGPNPDNYRFHVTVENLGANTASNVYVTNLLTYSGSFPLYYSNAVASAGTFAPAGAPTGAEGGLWTLASLARGGTATLTFVYGGSSSTTFTNTATVTASLADPDPANNTDQARLDKDFKSIDFALGKSAAPDPVNGGGTLTYTLTATNTSTADDWKGTGKVLTIIDPLPAGAGFVSAAGTDWSCVYDSETRQVTCTYIKDVNKGQTRSFNITVTAPPTSGSLTNLASLSYENPTAEDNVPNNDTARVTTAVVQSTDILVTQSADNPYPSVNSNVVFTITAANLGSNPATNLRLTNALPAGLTFASAITSQGTFDAPAGAWFVGSLAAGASATLHVTATVTTGGWSTNQAGLGSLSETDTNAANDSASSAVFSQSADLALGLAADPQLANVGSNILFTVALTNLGPDSASNILVEAPLPSGLVHVNHSASRGAYDAAAGRWTLPTLARDEVVTLELTAQITRAGNLTNEARISLSSLADPDPGNDTAGVIVTGQLVDLGLTLTVDNDRPVALGNSVVFTISLTNQGPSTATGVAVLDTFSAGLGYVAHTVSHGSFAAISGVWTVGTLTNGESALLSLTATNGQLGRLTNAVTVQAVSEVETNRANNSAQLVVLSGGEADLYLTKTVNTPNPRTGELITYTLTLDNYGPDVATGVAARDLLPAGVSFAEAISPGTLYDRDTGIWTVGTLSAGQSVQLWLKAYITGTGQVLNHAAIVASNGADPDPLGDSANATVNVISVNSISGRVFRDNGASGGNPNDGVRNGGESGLAGVLLRLTDGGGATTYGTATTDGAGYYVIAMPASLTNTVPLRLIETTPPGFTSTGAVVGNTGGSYDRESDTISFTFTPGSTCTNVDFGEVAASAFQPDGQQAGLPGTVVLYPHRFTAGTAGEVTFTLTSEPSPALPGWSQVLYRDLNGNSRLEPDEPTISGPITVAAAETLHLLLKEFIPVNAPLNARDQVIIAATLTFAGASPALATVATVTDLTSVGTPTAAGLTLLKIVDKETARPGETITYTITYQNLSSEPLGNVVIHDETPAFTTFLSAVAGDLPDSLSAALITAPDPDQPGPLRWTFTGPLLPGATGTVSYSVKVAE